MTVLVTLPDYDKTEGYRFQWEDGFEIKTESETGYLGISANKEGLISLAHQLLYLAQDSFPAGYHLHYDSFNSLADGSKELVISKI
jgi:hypothetical protein